jgi:hypothetical protein
MTIDQKTIAELLQLGGQYFLPVAALLRAIYSGIRGKFPEGFMQIGAASLFAGVTAAVGGEQPDLGTIIVKILSNTVFMAGLLSFIMTYLLRQPNRGLSFDAVVGGILGIVAWAIWVPVLQNDWPWWTAPLAVLAGAVAMVVLRRLLRQIAKLVRIATWAIVIGIILVIGAGAIYLLQTLLTAPA